MSYSVEQSLIINSSEKYIFVLAGAGSGKTFTIIERINKLLDNNIEPSSILCITFSKKAASTLHQRLKNSSILVSTIHSFCYQNIDLENKILIKDSDLPFNERELLIIYKYKTSLKKGKKNNLIRKYYSFLQEKNNIDYCDLLILFLKSNKVFNYKYIFVDEFQDINNLEYQVIKHISNNSTNLFCVGDPDQSIYAFKGSNSKIIYRYIKQYNAKNYLLTTNYRSVSNIIHSSNKVIKHNNRILKKNMIPTNQTINKTIFNIYEDIEAEALNITSLIENLSDFNKIAILFRNHYQSYSIRRVFIEKDIPFSNKEHPQNYGVSLLSIHESKGTEFDYVFIIGATDKNHLDKCQTLKELEEERRIFYVAITRVRKQLYISYFKYEKRLRFIDEM